MLSCRILRTLSLPGQRSALRTDLAKVAFQKPNSSCLLILPARAKGSYEDEVWYRTKDNSRTVTSFFNQGAVDMMASKVNLAIESYFVLLLSGLTVEHSFLTEQL